MSDERAGGERLESGSAEACVDTREQARQGGRSGKEQAMFLRTNLNDKAARFRRRGALLVATSVAVLGAAAGTAATAQATTYYSKYPTPFFDYIGCAYSPGYMNFTQTTRRIILGFQIDGANLYPVNTVEQQEIYVNTAVYNTDTGEVSFNPNYELHGWSTGQDNLFAPQWDHVHTWYNIYGQEIANENTAPFWNIGGTGHYRVRIHIRWDRSSSGAPAGSYDWMWLPGSCYFP